MVLWIIIGIVVAAIVVWAFWPRRGRFNSAELRRRHNTTQGFTEQYRPPATPRDLGPHS